MIERIKQVLAPPVFAGDDDKTRTSRLLNLLLLCSLLGVVVYLPFAAQDRAPIAILAAGVVIAVWFTLIRGHVRFASLALVAGLALVIGTGTWTGGGVRSPAYGGMTMLILFAGILLGWKASIGMALLSVLYGVVLLRYDSLGLLPAPTAYSSAGYWVIESIFFILAGLILTISLRLTNEALERARHEIAERREAESSLRKSEAFVENVLDSLTAHIAVLNDRGVIIAVNAASRAFARENGGEDEAQVSVGANYFVVCQKAIERQSDPLAREALDGIRRVMDGGQSFFSMEYPCHSLTEQRWFSMNVLPLENMGGRVVIAHENVTRFKRAEELIRANTQLLETMGENIPNAYISVINDDLTIGFTTGGEFKAQGLDPDNFIGLHVNDVFKSFGGEILKAVREGYERTFEGQAQSFELFVDGQFQSYDTVPLRDDKGLIRQILVLTQNVTERRRAEQILSDAHQKLRAVTTRLYEVEEAERRALSRELHDRVGQNLTALSISLQNLKHMLPDDSARAVGGNFDDAQELVQDTTRIIREIMSELHPPELEDHGLVAAIETYAEKAVTRAGMELTARLPEPEIALPLETSTAIYRAAQEAVNNVLKHAEAQRIRIELDEQDHTLRLRITDDGQGFDASAPRAPQSWGLRIMQERLESVGGNVQVESDPGSGTIVTFEVAVEA